MWPSICVLILSLLLINQGVSADEISDAETQLEKINQLIDQIERQLADDVNSHKKVRGEMDDLEREIGKLHKNIEQIKHEIGTSRADHQRLSEQSTQLNQQLQSQQSQFEQQMRLAYVSGTQSKWKLLLSQNSLQHFGRNALIYDYIHQAQVEQIKQMENLATDIQQNQLSLEKEQKTLQKLLIKQSNVQNELKTVRKQKQVIQASLATKIESSSASLKNEKSRQTKLKKLLKNLTVKHSKGKFSQQRGKLSWPKQR